VHHVPYKSGATFIFAVTFFAKYGPTFITFVRYILRKTTEKDKTKFTTLPSICCRTTLQNFSVLNCTYTTVIWYDSDDSGGKSLFTEV